MIFIPLEIEGAFLITREANEDERGYFARSYCEKEFEAAGIKMHICQINVCVNKEKNTLRGMHLQLGEKAEDKLVSCNRGAIYDVFVDMRKNSKTYLKYYAHELSEKNGCMLYIPKGCAHGYLTLQNDCQLLYLMSEFYEPGASTGYKYDDPVFGIEWPSKDNLIISDKDKKWDYL